MPNFHVSKFSCISSQTFPILKFEQLYDIEYVWLVWKIWYKSYKYLFIPIYALRPLFSSLHLNWFNICKGLCSVEIFFIHNFWDVHISLFIWWYDSKLYVWNIYFEKIHWFNVDAHIANRATAMQFSMFLSKNISD